MRRLSLLEGGRYKLLIVLPFDSLKFIFILLHFCNFRFLTLFGFAFFVTCHFGLFALFFRKLGFLGFDGGIVGLQLAKLELEIRKMNLFSSLLFDSFLNNIEKMDVRIEFITQNLLLVYRPHKVTFSKFLNQLRRIKFVTFDQNGYDFESAIFPIVSLDHLCSLNSSRVILQPNLTSNKHFGQRLDFNSCL